MTAFPHRVGWSPSAGRTDSSPACVRNDPTVRGEPVDWWSRFALCLLTCWAVLLPAFTVLADERPNVVFILTDNQGAWTLGCYGNDEIATPHIDRLADEGVLMTRAFASNPVCSPTRATFLTGLLPSQHGVHCFLRAGRLQTGPDARNTLEEFDSLPQVLKQHGYRCGLVGKWHLGGNLEPQEGLEDYWVTMPHGGTSTFYDAEVIENGEIRTEPKYLTEFWTDHAVKFIEQEDERPFFLYLAYNGPYALGRLLLNEPRNRHAERYAEMELSSFPRGNPHAWQFNNLDYMNNPVSLRRVAAEVSGVDDGVGRVMAALKERGLDENTLVIYSSDQGWVGGHGGFFRDGRPHPPGDRLRRHDADPDDLPASGGDPRPASLRSDGHELRLHADGAGSSGIGKGSGDRGQGAGARLAGERFL
jgi:hypothetical protein